jgi:hypothetical protein
MNQETNGSDDSQRQSRKDFEVAIKDYWDKVGLSCITTDHLAIETLESTHTDRADWTEEKLNDASFALIQYAIYLQKEENFHRARMNWAQNNLKIMYGNFGYKYGNKYSKYEERMAIMIGQNAQAEMLHRFIKDIQGNLDSLYFVSTKIEKLSKILDERQQILKRKTYQR